MSTVAVIDYGMGNLHSIAKALQHADSKANVVVTGSAAQIAAADRVVLPGVGAMRDCMQALQSHELIEVIHQVARNKPLLGICLGMQAFLTDSTENGHVECLDLIAGHVRRFDDPLIGLDGNALKVPHMGWNGVSQKRHPLWRGIAQDTRFYFVHSYVAYPNSPAHSLATSDYPKPFTCAIGRDNLFAVQFHPEKSQTAGLQLLNNFLNWDGQA